MERYLSVTIRSWIAIHAAFLFIQILYTFALTDGPLPTRTVSLFDHITGKNDTRGELGSEKTGEVFNKIEVDLQDTESKFTNESASSRSFLSNIMCRISSIGLAFQLVYSLFTLNYPFIDQIEEEAARFDDQAGLVLTWIIQVVVWAGILSGLILTVRIGYMAIQSGLIGSVMSAAIRSPFAALTITAATVVLPGLAVVLQKIMNC